MGRGDRQSQALTDALPPSPWFFQCLPLVKAAPFLIFTQDTQDTVSCWIFSWEILAQWVREGIKFASTLILANRGGTLGSRNIAWEELSSLEDQDNKKWMKSKSMMQGEDFSWQKPQTFILSVGNNSQGHSYTRWLWKGLVDYRMHVKESTWANLNGTQWLQSLQSLKPSSKSSWSVWHSQRAWNYAFNSLSLAFGKNSPSRSMWNRSAPPRWARTVRQSVEQLWQRQMWSLGGQDWDIQQRGEQCWCCVGVLLKDLWTTVTHLLSLIFKIDELIRQMDSCSEERRGRICFGSAWQKRSQDYTCFCYIHQGGICREEEDLAELNANGNSTGDDYCLGLRGAYLIVCSYWKYQNKSLSWKYRWGWFPPKPGTKEPQNQIVQIFWNFNKHSEDFMSFQTVLFFLSGNSQCVVQDGQLYVHRLRVFLL